MKPLRIKYAIVEHVLALKVNMSLDMKNALFLRANHRRENLLRNVYVKYMPQANWSVLKDFRRFF